MRPAARPGAGDDVGPAVAGDVGRGDGHAAAEGRVVGREDVEQLPGAAVPDFHDRAAADAGTGDDLGLAVAVDVPDREVDAAGERRLVGHKAADELSGA